MDPALTDVISAVQFSLLQHRHHGINADAEKKDRSIAAITAPTHQCGKLISGDILTSTWVFAHSSALIVPKTSLRKETSGHIFFHICHTSIMNKLHGSSFLYQRTKERFLLYRMYRLLHIKFQYTLLCVLTQERTKEI